jgi:hypothetical protein
VIGIWLETLDNAIPKHGSILALTDNSSCVAWLHKCSFDSLTERTECQISCHLAHTIISNNIQLHAQHVPGKHNKLADALSRKSKMNNDELTIFSLQNFPNQVPQRFRICQIPEKVHCWISSILQRQPQYLTDGQNQQTKKLIWSGLDGQISSNKSASPTTSTWMDMSMPTESSSQQHSFSPSDPSLQLDQDIHIATLIQQQFWEGLLETPQATWLRNLETINGQVPFTNMTDRTRSQIPSLFKAWANIDPPVRRNCAITPKHMRFLHIYAREQGSHILQSLAELVTGAFFFACRSCKYLSVVVRGKTKILCVRNIQFTTKDYTEIENTDPDLTTKAHFVSGTFEAQKNNMKMERRTQQRNNDNLLCPFRAWAATIQRIMKYPKSTPNTPVNIYANDKNTPTYFSQKALNTFLQKTVQLKPPMYFGYAHTSIGTHTIRSGAAKALYLADAPPHKIMLLGRWSSDAFLLYLRPEVLSSFSQLSKDMIQTDDFRHALSNPDKRLNNETRHSEDTLRHGDTRSIMHSRGVNLNGAEKPSNSQIPQFHLYH